MPTRPSRLLALAPALVLLASLAACGGGGSAGSSTELASKSTAQSVSAGGAALPADSTEATTVAVAAAKAVIQAGSTTATVNVAVNCGDSGTATYTVTGTSGLLTNGVLDAGESYSITFNQCKGSSGAAAVNGQMGLSVTSNAPLTIDTTTTSLSVTLPLRTVTQTGSSHFTQSVSGSGTTTTVNRWTSNGIHIDSQLNSGAMRRYELSNVDYTRSIVAVNGVPVSSSCEGHSNFDAQLGFFTWFITLATLGPINYDASGTVVSGHWSIDLPDDHLDLLITPSTVSLRIDLGNNGSDDLVFTFARATFFAGG